MSSNIQYLWSSRTNYENQLSWDVDSLLNPDFSSLIAEYQDILGPYVSQKILLDGTQDENIISRPNELPPSKATFYPSKQLNENKKSYYFDFKKGPDADCALAQALAHKYFAVKIHLNPFYLCPRIPNRFLYVQWLRELLYYSNNRNKLFLTGDSPHVLGNSSDVNQSLSKNTILDIGVGSSCIYPLLICSLEPEWQCIGTDISAKSLEIASNQVNLNPHLKDRIRLLNVLTLSQIERIFPTYYENTMNKISPSNVSNTIPAVETSSKDFPVLKRNRFFFFGDIKDDQIKKPTILRFDASICNPPFYDSEQSIQESRNLKTQVPSPSSQNFHAQTHELITEGGEYLFVSDMISESQIRNCNLSIRNSSKTSKSGSQNPWYTSMIGHKSTLIKLVALLRERKINNYVIHEIVTSSKNQNTIYKTRRWIIGWNFGYSRPPVYLSSCRSHSLKQFNPDPSEAVIIIPYANIVSVEEKNKLQENSMAKRKIIFQRIDNIIQSSLDFENNPLCGWSYNKEVDKGYLTVNRDIWSRSYRRCSKSSTLKTTQFLSETINIRPAKKFKIEQDQWAISQPSEDFGLISEFELTIRYTYPNYYLLIWWKYGSTPALLPSLCGVIKRRLYENS